MDCPPAILVTAGSAGLGAAAARLFTKNGYRVAVNYSNNADRANSLLNELPGISPLTQRSAEENFAVVKADLGSRDEIKKLVEETVGKFGRLDVVFSNGGWTRVRGLVSIEDNVYEEEWDQAFNMNVKSHLWLMQAAKTHLDKTEGAFITTASLAGVSVSGSSLVSDNIIKYILASVLNSSCRPTQ
jgi:NAD(P)-dependent dehydrogenase (short-subunit alcohol dehydrogenase family)